MSLKYSLAVAVMIVLFTACKTRQEGETIDPENIEVELEWIQMIGGTSTDAVRSIIQTADGGFALAGYTFNRTDQNPNYDFLIIKTGPRGQVEWQKRFGGRWEDKAKDIIETPDGSFIVAGYAMSKDIQVKNNYGKEDVCLLKLDPKGNIIWQRIYGGSDTDVAEDLLLNDDGSFLVTGYSYSDDIHLTFNRGSSDFWTIKFDPDGKMVWQSILGGSNEEKSYQVVHTHDDGYLVAGYCSSIDGNIISRFEEDEDAWIVKLDADGHLEWEKSFGGLGRDKAFSVITLPDKGFVIGGISYSSNEEIENKGDSDFYVFKVNKKGKLQWQQTYGGNNRDELGSLCYFYGSFIAAGHSYSQGHDVAYNHRYSDCWTIGIEEGGRKIWGLNAGGFKFEKVNSVISCKDGSFVLAGITNSPEFEGEKTQGKYDIFIMKFKPLVNLAMM